MKRAKPISLGEALKNWATSRSISGPFARGRVIAAWEDLLSDQMRSHIDRSWVKGSRLFVQVSSPAWRQELHMRRKDWCERLNTELGGEVITEIVFR